ncbi:MAG: DUF1294 domain-containing protein [Clostridiales bacterium]|nr:DUF1294 domain-containing protein [Clostridiales bacterium]
MAICLILLLMNLLAFALMGIDKAKAKAGAWRIPEKTLFLVTALFGGLGGTAGMYFFRHKTKHWYFKYGFPALLLVQLVLLTVILPKLL